MTTPFKVPSDEKYYSVCSICISCTELEIYYYYYAELDFKKSQNQPHLIPPAAIFSAAQRGMEKCTVGWGEGETNMGGTVGSDVALHKNACTFI